MFQLENQEIRQFRMLITLPLLLGGYFLLRIPVAIELKDAVPDGSVQIVVEKGVSGNLEFIELTEKHEKKADHVIINEATHDELMKCPGIGAKKADLIILERKFGPFKDWRDFQDRVKGIGASMVNQLQEAGVKLSP